MMFILRYKLDRARPAEYNPRVIDAAAFRQLCRSVRSLGPIKPIIVTTDGTIIAGHQRLRAMRRIGLTHAPAHVLCDVGRDDEIRFNQLHNASDIDIIESDVHVRLPRGVRSGSWKVVPSDAVNVRRRPESATRVNEICRLLARHGPWGGCVATPDGRVIAGALYAHSAWILGTELHVRVIGLCQVDEVRRNLSRQYGQFSYRHLPRTTWAQSMAQRYRLRGHHTRSRTYDREVIPRITRDMRILDFGAGQMDYVKLLRRRGYDIIGLEFYRRATGALTINVDQVHRDIYRVCESLRSYGLFDAVICDSVVNSVDTARAQEDVLTSINALCRPGGLIVFSGRRRAFEEASVRRRVSRSAVKRGVHFLDDQGFTSLYQSGVWLYQRLHTDDQVRRLARRYVGDADTLRFETSAWAVAGQKSIEAARPEASLRREFDLPLPDGSRYGRAEDILAAWQRAQELRDEKGARSEQKARARLSCIPTNCVLVAPLRAKGARSAKRQGNVR